MSSLVEPSVCRESAVLVGCLREGDVDALGESVIQLSVDSLSPPPVDICVRTVDETLVEDVFVSPEAR